MSSELLDIDKAWDEFLEVLQNATDALRTTASDDPRTRAEAYDFLQGALASAWIGIGHPDRNFPVIPEAYSEVMNLGSPCGDFVYQTLHIEPKGIYRIWGNRGSAAFVDMQQVDSWFGENEHGTQSETLSNDSFDELAIDVAKDGSYEIIFSVDKPESGDWLPRNSRTRTLIIRIFILDWGIETPTTFNAERLDCQEPTPGRRTLAESLKRIRQQTIFLRDLATTHSKFMDGLINDVGYNAVRRISFDKSSGHLDQIYWGMAMQIEPDEALLLEWAVGEAESVVFWGAVVNDSRWCVLDYRSCQSSLNNVQAEVDNDGVFRAIVSSADPGIANWLDTNDGEGKILMLRAKLCPGMPDPVVRRMTLKTAVSDLKERATPVLADQRAASLRQRRIDYDHRYKGR